MDARWTRNPVGGLLHVVSFRRNPQPDRELVHGACNYNTSGVLRAHGLWRQRPDPEASHGSAVRRDDVAGHDSGASFHIAFIKLNECVILVSIVSVVSFLVLYSVRYGVSNIVDKMHVWISNVPIFARFCQLEEGGLGAGGGSETPRECRISSIAVDCFMRSDFIDVSSLAVVCSTCTSRSSKDWIAVANVSAT